VLPSSPHNLRKPSDPAGSWLAHPPHQPGQTLREWAGNRRKGSVSQRSLLTASPISYIMLTSKSLRLGWPSGRSLAPGLAKGIPSLPLKCVRKSSEAGAGLHARATRVLFSVLSRVLPSGVLEDGPEMKLGEVRIHANASTDAIGTGNHQVATIVNGENTVYHNLCWALLN